MARTLFTNLLECTFISIEGTNRICACKSIKTTKLCTGELYSLFVVRHVGTSTARHNRHVRVDALDTSNVSIET